MAKVKAEKIDQCTMYLNKFDKHWSKMVDDGMCLLQYTRDSLCPDDMNQYRSFMRTLQRCVAAFLEHGGIGSGFGISVDALDDPSTESDISTDFTIAYNREAGDYSDRECCCEEDCDECDCCEDWCDCGTEEDCECEDTDANDDCNDECPNSNECDTVPGHPTPSGDPIEFMYQYGGHFYTCSINTGIPGYCGNTEEKVNVTIRTTDNKTENTLIGCACIKADGTIHIESECPTDVISIYNYVAHMLKSLTGYNMAYMRGVGNDSYVLTRYATDDSIPRFLANGNAYKRFGQVPIRDYTDVAICVQCQLLARQMNISFADVMISDDIASAFAHCAKLIVDNFKQYIVKLMNGAFGAACNDK